jgi:hypothetical protein
VSGRNTGDLLPWSRVPAPGIVGVYRTEEESRAIMNKTAVLVASASLLLWGCGSDDGGGGATQSELADLLLEDSAGVVDEECIRDKTGELSDDDAQFLVDNIDAVDTEGFSSELQDWVEGLIDCFSLAESEP